MIQDNGMDVDYVINTLTMKRQLPTNGLIDWFISLFKGQI